MSTFNARVLAPDERPTAADFPSLARPGIIWEDDRWWRFTERTDLHDVRYLAVRDEDNDSGENKIAALAPLLISRGDGLLFYDAPKMVGNTGAFGCPERFSLEEQRHWDDLVSALPDARRDQYPSLSLGVFGSHHGIVHARGRTPAERSRVLAEMPHLLDKAAGELGCRSSSLLYVTCEQAETLRPAAEALGYTRAALGAESVLRLETPSWEDYLTGLSSRKRIRVKREMRGYAEAGFHTVIREGPDALTDSVIDLQVALRAKYGLPGGRARVQRDLDAMRETVGDSMVVITAERDGATHGFVLHLRAGDAIYGRTAGFSDDARGVYFTLTYHETIRWSLAHGIRSIWYGLAAYQAKKLRGCAIEPRLGWFRFTGAGAGSLAEALRLQSASEHDRLRDLTSPDSITSQGS